VVRRIFVGGILKEVNETCREHCLKVLRCIVAHYELRTLLSQDFAVGIIGGGKHGKSTLCQKLFGFDSNPSGSERTVDMYDYRVSERFHVIDFPHLTSHIDSLRACFKCNYTLVNAIIVVLDALQQGDDAHSEKYVVDTIKKFKKGGVEVLFCFNKADKLATKKKFDGKCR